MSQPADEDEIYYLEVEDILGIHRDVIEEDPDADPGIRNRGHIEYTVDHLTHHEYDGSPETIHEKAYQLMRLIASGHAFVDGNKRTAMASAMLFYFINGYELEHRDELESMLILLSIRESYVSPEVASDRLETITEEVRLIDYLPSLKEFVEDFTEQLDSSVGPIFIPTQNVNESSTKGDDNDE